MTPETGPFGWLQNIIPRRHKRKKAASATASVTRGIHPLLPAYWENLALPVLESVEESMSPPSPQVRFLLKSQLPWAPFQTEFWLPKDRFYLYCLYFLTHGSYKAVLDLIRGQRVILGLRKETSTKANKGKGLYDDLFVVLKRDWPHRSGWAYRFLGNTEPAWKYDAKNPLKSKTMGQDADGDGVEDLGRIPAGTHRFKKGYSAKRGNILIPTESIRLERDTNHDGWFHNDKFNAKLEGRLYAGDTFFHKGGLGGFTGSAGCQTLEGPIFQKFWDTLGNQSVFYYVLVSLPVSAAP